MSAAVKSPNNPPHAGAPLSDVQGDGDDTPAGDSDAVLGIASWPGTGMDWRFMPASDESTGATLAVNIAMHPTALLPTATAAGDAAAAAAREIATRFEAIERQLAQPDMQLSLATSLNQPAGGTPIQMPVEMLPLRAHAAACHAFSQAAATLGVAMADPAAAATLADVPTHYGVDWQAIGLAAGDRPLGTLVYLPPEGLRIPAYATFTATATVAKLVPEDLDPAAVLTAHDNATLPLNPGIELVIPPADRMQPTDGLPLVALAAALHLTPASLVAANCARAALLAPGFSFEADGVEWTVPPEGHPGADASLKDIARLFPDTGQALEAAAVALASADKPGMFRSGAMLAVDRRLIEAGWTLADNPTGIAPYLLAKLNAATIDLLPAGSALFLKATLTAGLDSEPLRALANAHAIAPGDLLCHNAGLPVRELPIPGLSAWAAPPLSPCMPYRIRAGQTLSAIAALFVSSSAPGTAHTDERALCEANRSIPATLAPGQMITVAGQPLTTQAGDSFDTLMARAEPPITLDDFAAAIATDTEALAAGALLLCPPALLANAAAPKDLATVYGLAATAVLRANAATPKLIVPGLVLQASQVADAPTVATTQADSIHAILRRFALAGIGVTIEDLVRANHGTVFLAAGAQLLLPPADTVLRATFGTGGWQLPQAIFPLHTWVTLKRDADRVPPALRGTADAPGAAVQDISVVAAIGSGTCDGQEDSAVVLDQLAATIEGTVKGLKLATEHGPAPSEVWGASFVNPGGITQVKVSPQASVPGIEGLQPLSFALRPLSNTLERANGVEIRSINAATGSWGASTFHNYEGIDLEVWARTWLAGMDQLCSDRYATPAALVAPEALTRLLAAKKVLAHALADGLQPILMLQAQSIGAFDSEPWQAAREAMREHLQDQLLSGYGTAAILQFNATVASPATAASARLRGTGRLGNPQAANTRQSPCDAPDPWRIGPMGHATTALADTRTGTVSFPLALDQPTSHKAVALRPDYAVHEIEVATSPASTESGLWKRLSFLRDFDRFPPAAFSAPLGTPVVPIPLRSYPHLPIALAQRAAGPTAAATLAQALHWSYVFTYAHDSAAQDQALVEIEFNGQPPAVTSRPGDEDGNALVKALAQYDAVQAILWQLLAQLQAPSVSSKDSVLANALHVYADLAERVAALWADWWTRRDAQGIAQHGAPPPHRASVHSSQPVDGQQAPQPSAGTPSDAHAAALPGPAETSVRRERYQYLATLGTTAVGEGMVSPVYSTLTLQRQPTDGPVAWPEITTIRADGTHVPLTGAAPVDQTRVYHFPSEEGAPLVPAFTPVSCQWTFSDLHVAHYQEANATVAVMRNAQLMGTDGALTCSDFVYRTPQKGFSETLTPRISIDTPLPIGTWTNEVATNPLTPLFNALLDGDVTGREIMVCAAYGYRVETSSPPIEPLMPVMLLPPFEFDATSTVQNIIDGFEAWRGNVAAPTHGSFLSFEISLYPNADPARGQPLLTLQRVVLSLA